MPRVFVLVYVQGGREAEWMKAGGALCALGRTDGEDDTTVAWKTRYLTVFTRMLQLDFKVFACQQLLLWDIGYHVMPLQYITSQAFA